MATKPKLIRKMAIRVAVETVAGTEVIPTDAMLVRNVNLVPLEGEEVDNDFVKPYFGNSGNTLVTEYTTVAFEVPFSGVSAAAAGTAPGYAGLLRACAASLTLEAGVAATFAPVTDDIESVTIYAYLDGALHKMIGARGNVRISANARALPVWQFAFTGAFRPVQAQALPAVTYTQWLLPLGVNKLNTTLDLHGFAVACSAFELDFGNNVVKQDLINVDTTEITGRSSTGSVTIRNTDIADKDWIAIARAGTEGSLALKHGPGAANVVEVGAPRVRIGKPTFSEQDGIQMVQLPLSLIPTDAGNDEWSIKVY